MTLRAFAASIMLALSLGAGVAAAADLMVTQTGGGAASASQTRSFVITASSVTGALPPGLTVTVSTTLVGATPNTATGTGWVCATAGLVVTCTRSNGLGSGAAYPAITVSAVTGLSGNYSSCAFVSYDANPAVQPDQVALNNKACVKGPIADPPAPAVLTIEKFNESTKCSSTGVNNPCKFKMRIRNMGGAAYNGPVSFSDTVTFIGGITIANSTTPVAPLPAGWTCSASGPPVTCSGTVNLPPGQSVDVILFLKLNHPTLPTQNCVRLTTPITTQPFCLTM